MTKYARPSLAACLALALLVPVLAGAQTVALLRGVVRDSQGLPLPTAEVSLS